MNCPSLDDVHILSLFSIMFASSGVDGRLSEQDRKTNFLLLLRTIYAVGKELDFKYSPRWRSVKTLP